MKNFFAFTALFAVLLFGSCSKDKKTVSASRLVKYEITGTMTGNFIIVYTNLSGVAENVTVQSLPWSKELTVQNSVQAVVFSSTGTTTAGKVATAKIYIGGVEKQSATQTADANGTLAFGGLSFTY